MQIRIYSPTLEIDRELREHVERRFSFALDNVAGQVSWVGVRLGNAQIDGSTAKRCKVEISLHEGVILSVEEMDRSIVKSVTGAASRAGMIVKQHLSSPAAPGRSRARNLSRIRNPGGHVDVHNTDQWQLRPRRTPVPSPDQDQPVEPGRAPRK